MSNEDKYHKNIHDFLFRNLGNSTNCIVLNCQLEILQHPFLEAADALNDMPPNSQWTTESQKHPGNTKPDQWPGGALDTG